MQTSVVEEFRIPDLKTILQGSRTSIPWWSKHVDMDDWNLPHVNPSQEPDLAKKLGIVPDERVFVVAGCFGDWANALSRTNRVIYSDVSKKMASRALERYPRLKERALIVDGVLLPIGKDIDWLFSYDPLALGDVQLSLVLLHGMSRCKKGIIIVCYTEYDGVERVTRSVSDIYHANFKTLKIQIKASDISAPTPKRIDKMQIIIFKVLKTNTAERRATLDLDLMLLLQQKVAGTTKIHDRALPAKFFGGVQDKITGETIVQLEKALKKSKSEILDSLRRITKLSDISKPIEDVYLQRVFLLR